MRQRVNLQPFPAWLSEQDEAALRYALNLARTTLVRAPDGSDVDLGGFLAPFREDVRAFALPALLGPRGPDRAELSHAYVRSIDLNSFQFAAFLSQYYGSAGMIRTWSRKRLTLFAEVINLLNRENVRFNPPGVSTSTGRASNLYESLIPIVPSAGILIEF